MSLPNSANRQKANAPMWSARSEHRISKTRWSATIARRVADELVEALTPRCEQICIAGSLRRGKSEVGDIEILYVPRRGLVRRAGEFFPTLGYLGRGTSRPVAD
jgi:DNA polymerase/3'-5' exonuclease PolX